MFSFWSDGRHRNGTSSSCIVLWLRLSCGAGGKEGGRERVRERGREGEREGERE